MRFGGRAHTWGSRANEAAHNVTRKVDDTSGEATERLASVIVAAAKILRWPTAVVTYLPIPLIVSVLVLGVKGSGLFGSVLVVLGGAMAVVSAAFWGRRRRILQAVDDVDELRSELRQLVNLTGPLDEGAGTLKELAAGGGVSVFSRLRAAWRGVTLPARWLEQIGDLKRARYFAPPKIGTTATVTIAALWLVPISFLAAIVAIIGTLAGSL